MAIGCPGIKKSRVFHLTMRASLAPSNTLLFYTIFTQGQKIKYTRARRKRSIGRLISTFLKKHCLIACLITLCYWISEEMSLILSLLLCKNKTYKKEIKFIQTNCNEFKAKKESFDEHIDDGNPDVHKGVS